MAGRRGRPVVADGQPNFTGGLNVSSDISSLGPTELWRADNARLIEQGAITKRGGTQRTSTGVLAVGPVRGGFEWRLASGFLQLAICEGSLYIGTYGIPMTWTLVSGVTFAAGAQVAFVRFLDGLATDCVYMADGGKLIKYDGVTLSRVATSPNVSQLLVYNKRLLACGDAAAQFATYWSDIENGDTLGDPANGGGQENILASQAGKMVALGLVGDSVALAQESGLARFAGLTVDDISVDSGTRGFSPDTGVVAPRACVNYGSTENPAWVFLSDNGIYELAASGTLRTLTRKIDPVVSGLDQSTVARAVAVNFRSAQELWFYLPDVGMYIYNYRLVDDNGLGGWTGPFTGIYTTARVHSIWEATDTAGKRILLAGFGDGYVRRIEPPNVYLDDVHSDGTGGTAVTLVAQLHRMFFKTPANEKSMWRTFVTANLRGSSTATIAWNTSIGAGQGTFPPSFGGVWGAGIWDLARKWGSSGAIARRVDMSGRGTFVDITISDSGLSVASYSKVIVQAFDMGLR